MAIIGSLQDGLRGDFSNLLMKSGLDGIALVAFASTLGIGVLFSTLLVAVRQGGIIVGAPMLQPYLSSSIVNEMTATGRLFVLEITLNILQVTKIKVGNLLPAIVVFAILSGSLWYVSKPKVKARGSREEGLTLNLQFLDVLACLND